MVGSGLFVTVEGVEGAGKSTLIQGVVAALRGQGEAVTVVREPGGTPVGDRIRALLLDREQPLAERAEMLLFAASRAQLVEQVVRPALARGELVLCDRFVDSSLAYQGVGRGLGIERVAAVNREATGGLVPHLTLLLDLPAQEGLARADARRGREALDRFEGERAEFHRQIREAFLTLAAREPARFVTLDATLGAEVLQSQALGWIQARRRGAS